MNEKGKVRECLVFFRNEKRGRAGTRGQGTVGCLQ